MVTSHCGYLCQKVVLKVRIYAIKVFLDYLKIFVHLVMKYVKHVDDIPVCLYDINLLSL